MVERYRKCEHVRLALAYYEIPLIGEWDARFGDLRTIVELDYLRFLRRIARGDMKTARELASRAKTRFPTGSPGWVRADDIVGLKQPKTSFFSGSKFTIGPAQPRGPFTTGPTQ